MKLCSFHSLLDWSRQKLWLGEVALWFSGRTTRGSGSACWSFPKNVVPLPTCASQRLWEPHPLGKHPVTKNPNCWRLYSRQEVAPSYEQPTYETTHVVCNRSPAFTVQESLSLLETVTWKVTFIITESSRRLALTHGRSPGIGEWLLPGNISLYRLVPQLNQA